MNNTLKVAIFNDTSITDHYGCELVLNNLVRLIKKEGMEPVWFWPVAKDWRETPELLPPLGSVDLVIVNGEGSMHHSADRPRVEALADIGLMSREKLNVPAYLINATLHKNEPSIYEKLRHFNGIYVRDSMSLTELKDHGLSGEFVPDLTLAMPYTTDVKRTDRVGATDSVVREVNESVVSLCTKHNWSYMKMKNKPPKSRDKKGFKGILRRCRRRMRSIFRQKTDGKSFIEFLASKKLIITGRYHTATMCLLTNTPFVAFESNTPKVSCLLKDVFNSPDRLLQSAADLDDNLIAGMSEYSPSEREAIRLFLNKSYKLSKMMIQEIKSDTISNQNP